WPSPLTWPRNMRRWIATIALLFASLPIPAAQAMIDDPDVRRTVDGGLEWLASQQQKMAQWTAQGRYPTAMTALAGLAMLCEGSTTTQGKYAENIRRAVDF